MHYPSLKIQHRLRESMKTRQGIAYTAAESIWSFLNQSANWTVDPKHRYWAPESCRGGSKGINGYSMRLVALVNTHEQFWRCDIAIVRPAQEVPSDCSPTLLDPVRYSFF